MLQSDLTQNETISQPEAARFRAMDGWDQLWTNIHRNYAGASELIDCSECASGAAERIAVDSASDTGVSFEPVNGSSEIDGEYLCAACTAREVA